MAIKDRAEKNEAIDRALSQLPRGTFYTKIRTEPDFLVADGAVFIAGSGFSRSIIHSNIIYLSSDYLHADFKTVLGPSAEFSVQSKELGRFYNMLRGQEDYIAKWYPTKYVRETKAVLKELARDIRSHPEAYTLSKGAPYS